MPEPKLLRVAALVDLPRTRLSGGHIKGWERLVKAASLSSLPLDLTLFCSGPALTEEFSARARIKQIPPVFSTSRLKFLPYVPDNTDLGRYHALLAEELERFDLIHTTDGFFCFARTAEKVSKKRNIPLTTSFHTNTPSYARIFTKLTLEKLFGKNPFSNFLINTLKIPEGQEQKKLKRLRAHIAACSKVFYTRQEDRVEAERIVGADNAHMIRLGVDRNMLGPHRADRESVEADYHIPPKTLAFLFVGRLDVGKNIYTLIEAMEQLIAEGHPVHLITAGVGPAAEDLIERLGDHVTVAGFVEPEELARLYASVDALVMPSEVEIRSMATVEAMTSGLPVLMSQKCGVAQLFDYSPAIVEVLSGADAWAQALREFISSINKRAHMRKIALDYADTHIASWEEVLREDLFTHWMEAVRSKAKS